MLTLKAPVQLHITQALTANVESFCERLRGNYDLLGAHFAPKDLLFLMTAPPELPEEPGGMTTLVNQQNTVDVRSVTMEVVNNVVNRILLDGTEQFTYQDQVYISTVLDRLGISDAARFMEQVRQLRAESGNTLRLTQLYRDGLERIVQKQLSGEPVPPLPLRAEKSGEAEQPRQTDGMTLFMEIFDRLDTAKLYETIHAFQRSLTGADGIFRAQELRLSEQLRVSNAVALTELKQKLYERPQLHLLSHVNRYEDGTILEPPQDGEQVLSQAAAAALLSTVDHTVVEVLNRPQLRQEQWVSIQNALWQTAENSLSRFETYHSQPQSAAPVQLHADSVWESYAQELKEYQTLYRQFFPTEKLFAFPGTESETDDEERPMREGAQPQRSEQRESGRGESRPARDIERSSAWRETRELERRTLRELLSGAPAADGRADAPVPEGPELTYWNQTVEGDSVQNRQSTQIFNEAPRPVREERPSDASQPAASASALSPEEREAALRSERERELHSERLRETILRQLSRGSGQLVPQRETAELIPARAGEPVETLPERTAEHIFTERTDSKDSALYRDSRELERRTLRELFGRTEHETLTRAAAEPASRVLREGQSPTEEAARFPMREAKAGTAAPRTERELRTEIERLSGLWPPQPSARTPMLYRERVDREEERLRELRETRLHTDSVLERQERAVPWPEAWRRPVVPERTEVPPVTMTPREAEEQAPEFLREELTRIDQHNRTVLQAMREESGKKETRLPAAPDIQRTMRSALRALERPEEVLREIYESRADAPAVVHPAPDSGEEAILRQAGAENRALYETVLAYRKDPEGTLAKGLLRPGNQGALQAALRAAQEREVPVESLSAQPPEKELLRQPQTESAAESLARLTEGARAAVQESAAPLPAVKIVHKQTAPDVTEELLERMQERQTRDVSRTETVDRTTRQQTRQVDVNQIERKVVAQTTEDITELVNRTLARQMRSISDQVYRQMEKRLQAERSRRGRL